MSKRQDVQDATGRIEYIVGRGTMQAWGPGASITGVGTPVNGASGFAPGCTWQNTLTYVAGQCFFINVGTFASAQWLNIDGISFATLPRAASVVALNTVGAGTITAANIVAGYTTRGGAQSGSAFTDTTDTAALIIAGIGSFPVIGQSWTYQYTNNTDAQATLAGGTGVTITGTIVPKNTMAVYLVTYTAAGTITMVLVEQGPTVVLPNSQFVTQAYQAATFAAGDITGANTCHFNNTGTTPAALTVRTAAQMFADIPNCQVGFNYTLFIRNSSGSANTATITADGGATVTLTGTMTIAQNVTRMFNVKFPSATTCTIQSMGVFAAAV